MNRSHPHAAASLILRLSGSPEQIRERLAGMIRRFGGDMPLAYVLSLPPGLSGPDAPGSAEDTEPGPK
ncbi:hypothetical protein F4V43_02850 [Paenibacillus spiritus]|uniref:Uncharacterized protein n=1 Tax=Paenibacillus spiritus TaxID=2496557 RepID=A0A5J5GIC0_9BACL|nr:hypothetical protein [Paenibacillus spiritus]KAA9007443.1 hypothetical protein F4V43_02850 [Paenibacillus spiritus]